jgi:hypothetical protein
VYPTTRGAAHLDARPWPQIARKQEARTVAASVTVFAAYLSPDMGDDGNGRAVGYTA